MSVSRIIAAACIASGVSSEFPVFEDDDGLQLLQLSAKKHNQTQFTSEAGRGNGYCGFRGDTHTVQGLSDAVRKIRGGAADPQQYGLYNVANSKDGRFKVQTYQCPSPWSATVGYINAMAYDIDGTTIVILPPPNMLAVSRNMDISVIANGVDYTGKLPITIPGTTIDLRAHNPPNMKGVQIVTDGFSAHVEQLSYRDAVLSNTQAYLDTGLQLAPDNVPDLDQNSWCIKGPAATELAAADGDWSVSLFSEADHRHICGWCEDYWNYNNENRQDLHSSGTTLECKKPALKPPPPPAKVECEENDCSWTHAQQLCHSLQGDDGLYDDCLFDFCLECEDRAAVEFLADEEDEHPGPVCVAGAPECAPEEVCSKSVKMNTLTVTQNNLGGVGPDSGAEEIRYSNAAVVNGKAVDLVLTTDGKFQSSKPAKNGNAGPFGVLNVLCGSSVTISMKAVDSESGAPVTLEAVSLTWYDLDEGKKEKGRATVTTCGSTGAIVSANSELTVIREGDCSSATSSVAGTGKDNPKSPHALDSVQISRSLTLPFKQVSEWSSTLSLAKGFKGRNFLFALEPSVACGLPR